MSTRDTPDPVPLPALLRHARSTYGVAMRAALEKAGYDDVPKNGLYVIGGMAMEGDYPLAALIDDLKISKQAAGQLVDTLVERGYLEREVDPEDRRRLVLALSQRGRAAAKVQAAARARVDAKLAARLGDRAVETLRRGLMALIQIGREAP
ncbi:MAG TPA: MarR family winged helix-turn-helix transcriptional regulator [Polyangia bacterium]|nr:MarR family winged helix-turn-helix transcriptional regulator [Polyangia bacterium]